MRTVLVSEAISLLAAGGIVAIPTDTVYGLAAKLSCSQAIQELFVLKRRPLDNPFLVLLADVSQALSFMPTIPVHFQDLAQAFWPGALTLVVPVDTSRVDSLVRAGRDTVGFRVPAHSLALQLLKETGPLVCTSANVSGGAPATTAEGVVAIFGDAVPVLDGGPSSDGVASTIICYEEGAWRLTRQGSVSTAQLGTVIQLL